MSDRERTIVAAIVAILSAVMVMVGLRIGRDHLGGLVLIALGWTGVVQGVLIGLGVLKLGDNKHNRDR